ncbi:MAG: hypothetical protein ACWGMZ_02780 [Thermoguttaceae bacterium]
MKRLQRTNRAMVLILVLTCLAVATAILIAGVKLAVASHRFTRSFGWGVQAQWLIESGLHRAAAQLSSNANYTGETWNIPADVFGGQNAGTVKIEVKSIANQVHRRLLRVQADFPADPQDRVRYVKELPVNIRGDDI